MGSTSDAVGCDEILLLGLERQSRGVIASPRHGPARKCCAVSKPRGQGQDETQLGVLCAPPVAVRIGFLGQGFAARGSAGAQGLGFLPAFAPAGCSEPRASKYLVLCASPACWRRVYRKNELLLPTLPSFPPPSPCPRICRCTRGACPAAPRFGIPQNHLRALFFPSSWCFWGQQSGPNPSCLAFRGVCRQGGCKPWKLRSVRR